MTFAARLPRRHGRTFTFTAGNSGSVYGWGDGSASGVAVGTAGDSVPITLNGVRLAMVITGPSGLDTVLAVRFSVYPAGPNLSAATSDVFSRLQLAGTNGGTFQAAAATQLPLGSDALELQWVVGANLVNGGSYTAHFS